MRETKREETGSLPKYENQTFRTLYTQGGAAYGSLRNLAKASNLPASKLRQILLSKTSFTIFSLHQLFPRE